MSNRNNNSSQMNDAQLCVQFGVRDYNYPHINKIYDILISPRKNKNIQSFRNVNDEKNRKLHLIENVERLC